MLTPDLGCRIATADEYYRSIFGKTHQHETRCSSAVRHGRVRKVESILPIERDSGMTREYLAAHIVRIGVCQATLQAGYKSGSRNAMDELGRARQTHFHKLANRACPCRPSKQPRERRPAARLFQRGCVPPLWRCNWARRRRSAVTSRCREGSEVPHSSSGTPSGDRQTRPRRCIRVDDSRRCHISCKGLHGSSRPGSPCQRPGRDATSRRMRTRRGLERAGTREHRADAVRPGAGRGDGQRRHRR